MSHTRVQVWEEPFVIPTYELGPDDPNPSFHRRGYWDIYPYSMQDDLTGVKQDKTYQAIFLENQYLKLVVLPELGGHLYSVLDKTSGHELFYRNNVVKPGLVALRGAWISGGVEFNFPKGHTVTTVSPVDYFLVHHDDGSAGVVIGDLEKISRMKWSVEIRLYPDKAYLETIIRLYNRTPVPHRYYFWANAAVPATPRMQFIYPTRSSTGGQGFPIHNGVDVSYYVNHPQAGDMFARGVVEDFFGAYDHDIDAGVVHVANWHESYGKKFFTWGASGDGLIWANILSEHDGPYCEIQSGRFANQSVYELIEPYTLETWTEWWMPVKRTKGFNYANRDAAIHLKVSAETLDIGVHTTGVFPGTEIQVTLNDQILFQTTTDLSPDQPFYKTISAPEGVDKDSPVTLAVRSSQGELLIRYTNGPVREGEDLGDAAEPSKKPEGEMTAEELCLKALYMEKQRNKDQAKALYRKALEQDPGLTIAHCGLGRLFYKRGDLGDAEQAFRTALKRDTYCVPAHYYLGLILKEKGDPEEAANQLWRVFRDRAYAPLAYHTLGEIALIQGDAEQAEEMFRRALSTNPDHLKGQILLSASLRKQDRIKEASAWVHQAIEADPIDYLSRSEAYLLKIAAGENTDAERDALHRLARGDAQAYLEVAVDYGNAGLLSDAITILQEAVRVQAGHRGAYPLLHYYMGYYLEQSGDIEQAKRHYRLGGEMDPMYVFPHRIESIRVLRRVLEVQPDDARAMYYLGNLLFANGKAEEAIALWQRAAEIEPGFAIVHRNLGLAYRKRSDAIKEYRKAIAADSTQYRYYLDLDPLYEAEERSVEERLSLFENAPPSVRARGDVAARMASLYIRQEQYDEAIRLLTTHTFNPWEGARHMRNLYVSAYLGRGEKHYAAGNYEAALDDFKAATEYPTNIGVGKPARPQDAHALYRVGCAYEQLGDPDNARIFYEQASTEPHDEGSPLRYYEALALHKLGKEEEARAILDALIQFGERRLQEDPDHADRYQDLIRFAHKGKKEIAHTESATSI